MIIELSDTDLAEVSGGDELTHEWGTWVGAGIGEIQSHPIGAMFGVVGIVVAHYL